MVLNQVVLFRFILNSILNHEQNLKSEIIYSRLKKYVGRSYTNNIMINVSLTELILRSQSTG